jgi:hypothetical protein
MKPHQRKTLQGLFALAILFVLSVTILLPIRSDSVRAIEPTPAPAKGNGIVKQPIGDGPQGGRSGEVITTAPDPVKVETGSRPSDPPGAGEVRQEGSLTIGQPPLQNDTPKPDSGNITPGQKPKLPGNSGIQITTPRNSGLATGTTGSIPGTLGWSSLMTQTFEGTFPTGSWTVFDNDGTTNGEYYWDEDDYLANGGTYSAWAANGGANGKDPYYYYYPNNMQSWMVYGPVDLSTYTDAELLFYYWNESEPDYDYFYWMASTDGSDFNGYMVSGDSGGWNYINFDLTAVPTLGDITGDSSVWIAFIFTSDVSNPVGYDGPFVDDILLQGNSGARPNLVAFTPSGWSNPVVPSSVTGTTTTGTLYNYQDTYIDWAVVNYGGDISTNYLTCMYLDDVEIQCWDLPGLPNSTYQAYTDWVLNRPLTAGPHDLKIVTDPYDEINESDETDNTWEGTFTWLGPSLPNLTPWWWTGWDYPIVPSSVDSTNTVNTLYADQDTFIDWAVANTGTSTSTTFTTCLYYDDSELACWSTGGLDADIVAYVEDWILNITPTVGDHTLKIITDTTNAITPGKPPSPGGIPRRAPATRPHTSPTRG